MKDFWLLNIFQLSNALVHIFFIRLFKEIKLHVKLFIIGLKNIIHQ